MVLSLVELYFMKEHMSEMNLFQLLILKKETQPVLQLKKRGTTHL